MGKKKDELDEIFVDKHQPEVYIDKFIEINKKIIDGIKSNHLLARWVLENFVFPKNDQEEKKDYCEYCRNPLDYNKGSFQLGGVNKRLFGWCSKKCLIKFHKEIIHS